MHACPDPHPCLAGAACPVRGLSLCPGPANRLRPRASPVQSKSPRGSLYYDEEGALLRPSRRFEQQAERGMWGAARFSGGVPLFYIFFGGEGEEVGRGRKT